MKYTFVIIKCKQTIITETRKHTIVLQSNVFPDFNHENKVTKDNNVKSSEKHPLEKPVFKLLIIGDSIVNVIVVAKIEKGNPLLTIYIQYKGQNNTKEMIIRVGSNDILSNILPKHQIYTCNKLYQH